jgi:nicotinamidase-related amidase
MLRRDTIIIGGGATNRGVETSVREAFNFDLASVVVRECE